MWQPFNAWQKFIIARDRLHRVYLENGTLYFIRIGGQFAHVQKDVPGGIMGGAAAGGIIGGAAAGFAAWLAHTERILTPERLEELDRTPPSTIIGQHKHDVSIPCNEIMAATIAPWSFFRGNGSYIARWVIETEKSGKYAFQLDQNDDVKAALDNLPGILKGKLHVGVRWEESRNKYVKA